MIDLKNEERTITCSTCGGKLGFLNHKFKDEAKICNKCFRLAKITLTELSKRGQLNISIEEIKEKITRTESENNGLCYLCDRKLTIWNRQQLADAQICSQCLSRAKLNTRERLVLSKTRISIFMLKLNKDTISFLPTKTIGKLIKFDDIKRRLLIAPNRIIDYKDIRSFELMEDGDTIASGGLGRAAIGGVLFGGAGAMVGAVTGNRKESCSKLQIKLTVNNADKSAEYIKFIDKKVNKSSTTYITAFNEAQECLSTLEIICSHKENVVSGHPADEIMKFKELLDLGAITEEEYEAKKKQMLGI